MTTGVVDTGGEFAAGVNDAGNKFATGVNDASSKFATGARTSLYVTDNTEQYYPESQYLRGLIE